MYIDSDKVLLYQILAFYLFPYYFLNIDYLYSILNYHPRTRITLDQRFLQQSKAASIYIQKNFRRSIQKRKYVTLQDEAREEAQLNKKLAALQRRLIDAEMMAIKADKARLKAENHTSAGNGREKMVESQSQPIRLLDESTK